MQDRLDTPQSEGEAFRRVWQRVQGQPGPGDYLIPEGPGERPLPPAPAVRRADSPAVGGSVPPHGTPLAAGNAPLSGRRLSGVLPHPLLPLPDVGAGLPPGGGGDGGAGTAQSVS